MARSSSRLAALRAASRAAITAASGDGGAAAAWRRDAGLAPALRRSGAPAGRGGSRCGRSLAAGGGSFAAPTADRPASRRRPRPRRPRHRRRAVRAAALSAVAVVMLARSYALLRQRITLLRTGGIVAARRKSWNKPRCAARRGPWPRRSARPRSDGVRRGDRRRRARPGSPPRSGSSSSSPDISRGGGGKGLRGRRAYPLRRGDRSDRARPAAAGMAQRGHADQDRGHRRPLLLARASRRRCGCRIS